MEIVCLRCKKRENMAYRGTRNTCTGWIEKANLMVEINVGATDFLQSLIYLAYSTFAFQLKSFGKFYSKFYVELIEFYSGI